MTVNEIRKKLNNSVSDKNKLSSAEIEEQIKNRSFKGIDYEAADEEKRQIISHIPKNVNSKSNLQRAAEQRIKNEAAQKNSLSNDMSYEEKNKSLRNQEWKAYGKRLLTGLGYIASDENSRDIMYRDYQNARQQHKEIKAQHDELKQNRQNEIQAESKRLIEEDAEISNLVKKAYSARATASEKTQNAAQSDDLTSAMMSLFNKDELGYDTSKQDKELKESKKQLNDILKQKNASLDADELIAYYTNNQNILKSQNTAEGFNKAAQEHPVILGAARVLSSPYASIANAATTIGDLVTDGDYVYSGANSIHDARRGIKSGIEDKLSNADLPNLSALPGVDENNDITILDKNYGNVYSSLYDAIDMGAESAYNSLIMGGGLTGGIRARDLSEKIIQAGATGSFTSATMGEQTAQLKADGENIKDVYAKTGKDASLNFITEMLGTPLEKYDGVIPTIASEALEEVFGNAVSNLDDVIRLQDEGEIKQTYNKYIAEGKSESQALSLTVKELLADDIYVAGMAAVSSFGMAGGQSVLNSAQENNIYRSVGNELKKSGNAQAEINAGLAQDNTSKAYQAAAKLQSNLEQNAYTNNTEEFDYSQLNSRKLGRLAEYNAQEDARQLEKSAEVFEGDTAKSYVYAYGDNGYNGNVYDYNKGFNVVYMAQQQGKSINEAYDIALDEGSHITKLQAEIAYEAAKNDSENFSDIREIVYYSAKENNNSSIKQQLQNHSDELNNMDVVSKVDTSELSFNKKSMVREQAKSRFEKIYKQGGLLSNDGKFIEFTDKLVNGSLNYLKTPAEYAALFSIPDVIKNGKILDKHSEHKNRGYSTFTIMAPVEIDGIRGNAAAVIREVEGRNRYKVHRLLLPDGSNFVFDIKKDTEQGTYRPTSNDENLLTSSVSNNNVSYKTSVVNNHSMHYVEVDTSVKAKFDKAIHSEVKPGLTIIAKNITDDYRKAELKLIDNFAKKIDREVIIVDDTRLIGKDDANGFYEKGKIVLSLNADGGILLPYLGHELYHDLKVTSPIKAQKLEDFIIDFLKNSADYDYYARVDEIIELNDFKGTRQQQIAKANEEIAANACFTVLSERENFESLVKHDRSLAQKVRDFFADFIEKIKDSLDYIFLNTAEYKTLRDDPYAPEKILSMFNDCLKESQKNNTAINSSEAKYAIKYPKYTEEQLKDNARSVISMDSVISLKGNEFDGENSLSSKIDEYFSSLNNNIYSDEYGDVALNKASRRSDIRHGSTRMKNTAYVAIPDVIKNGKTIFINNKKGVERMIVAAPIEISNEKYFMGVMLIRDSNTQRLYLHDVITEKETELISGVSLNTTEANEIENNLFMTNILQKALSVNSNDMQDKAKYSLKEKPYSYEALTSKPDMKITEIDDSKKYMANSQTRKDIINQSIENAKKVGIVNENGNAVIYVDDIDKNIIVPKGAIKHSLDRRLNVNAHISLEIGKILKKSICINEMIPRTDNIEKSYVLIGIAKNKANEPYVVSFVVNKITNEVSAIDVLYAVNAKKEPTGSPLTRRLSPQVSTPATGSTISISDLLDYVNKYYPDLLPEDVLKHYGYKGRPEGVLGESALYSIKENPIDYNAVIEENAELSEMNEDLKEMLRLTSAQNEKLKNELLYAVFKQYGYNSSEYKKAENEYLNANEKHNNKFSDAKSIMKSRALTEYAELKKNGTYKNAEAARQSCIQLYGDMTTVNKALSSLKESQKNNITTNDSVIKYSFKDIVDIGKVDKENIRYKGGFVIESESDLKTVIEKSLKNKQVKENYYLGNIKSGVKEKITNDLGVDIFKSGDYSFLISSDDIRHISKHFQNVDDITNSVYRLYDVINNYDTVSIDETEKQKYNKNKLIFNKHYNDFDYRSVEIVSKKNRTFDLVSFFITKNNKKRNKGNGLANTSKVGGLASQTVSVSNNNVPQSETSVNSNDMQDKGKYSLKEKPYSYEALTSKPDMKITEIDDKKDYTPNKTTREDVVNNALVSALSVGHKDSLGNVFVYVDDIDTNVMVSKRGLRHSLDRRLSIIAPVTENIGAILKNSIRINELTPEFDTIEKSYALIGIAKNNNNEPYVVSFIVNKASNEIISVDVLYAVNAKKEATALIEPELSSQSDVSLTASTISISDLLDYVNKYYPDILPEDVLKHYGYKGRPEGVLGESALYSLKESVDDFSEQEYNEVNLSGKEYKKLYSEVMTWDSDKKNQILSRSLNGYRYYYSLDDEYNITVYIKKKSKNIHEVKDDVNRNSKRFSKRFTGAGSNGRYSRSGNISNGNGRAMRSNVQNAERPLSGKRQSDRGRNAENGNNDYLQEERYSIKGYKSALYIALKAVKKGDTQTYQEYADKIYATDDAYDLLYSVLVKYGYNSSQYRTAENRCIEIKKQNGAKEPDPKSSMKKKALKEYAHQKENGTYKDAEPLRQLCIQLYGDMTKVNEALEKLND